MEFKFNVNDLFKAPIVEINQTLVPPGFTGDRRALWDAVSKVAEVVNEMGNASAAAQGLTKPITTAERLRNSEHKIYVLTDKDAANGKGAITGMLKVGRKGLYIFDREGQPYQVTPTCVLDFYVHETRQRAGLGRHLFEHMLQHEQVDPVKMAIDRPSDKFLGFLNKHYSLTSPIKQMNNYVVFEGFFPEPLIPKEKSENNNSGTPGRSPATKQSANGLQKSYSSPYGRYGAPRPPCSMGQIIHNQSSTVQQNQEQTGNLNVKTTVSAPQQYVQSDYGQANQTQSAPNIQYHMNQQNQQNQQYEYYGQQQQQQYGQNAPGGDQTWQNLQTPQYTIPQQYVSQSQIVPSTTQAMPYTQQYAQPDMSQVVASQNYQVPQNIPYTQYTQPSETLQAVQNATYPQYMQSNMQASPMNAIKQQTTNVPYTGQYTYPVMSQPAMKQTSMPLEICQAAQNAPYQQTYITQSLPNMQMNPQYQQVAYQPQTQLVQGQSMQPQTLPQEQTTVQEKLIPQGQTIMTPGQTMSRGQTITQGQTNQHGQIMQGQPIPQGYVTSQPSVMLPQSQVLSQGQVATTQEQIMPQRQVVQQQIMPPQGQTVLQGYTTQQPMMPQGQAMSLPIIQQNQMPPQEQIVALAQTNVTHPGQMMQQVPSAAYMPMSAHMLPQIQNAQQGQVVPQTISQPQFVPQGQTASQAQLNQGYMLPQGQIRSQNQMVPQQIQNMSTMSQGQLRQQEQAVPQTQKAPETQQQQYNNRPSEKLIGQQMGDHSGDAQQNYEISRKPSAGGDRSGLDEKCSEYIFEYPARINPQKYRFNNRGIPQTIDNLNTPIENLQGQGEQYQSESQIKESHANPSPKLERPRSLSIQLSNEEPEKLDEKNSNDIINEVHIESNDQIDYVENVIEKLQINDVEASNQIEETINSDDKPAKKTPSHLTEQGFFDLKFYHNKLW